MSSGRAGGRSERFPAALPSLEGEATTSEPLSRATMAAADCDRLSWLSGPLIHRELGQRVPRGSKPGERRGGRQPGTPNKKTALVNAAFDAATSNPDLSPLDFLLEVMRDSSIPPDWRIKAALAALPYVHSKPERSPATDPAATARQIESVESGSDSDPLSEAIDAFRRGDYEWRRIERPGSKVQL
jgi:hypothetical protein